jgi:hypothetical protein
VEPKSFFKSHLGFRIALAVAVAASLTLDVMPLEPLRDAIATAIDDAKTFTEEDLGLPACLHCGMEGL